MTMTQSLGPSTGAHPTKCIDENAWALGEALWNWRALGLDGRTRRADLVTAAAKIGTEGRRGRIGPPAIVLGWAVNELAPAARGRLLSELTTLVERGSALLLIEPIARTLTPWWAEWVERLSPHGAESHDWKFDIALPGRLAEIDHEAGFRREGLSARTLSCGSRGGAPFLQ